jgi:hypothetical protein
MTAPSPLRDAVARDLAPVRPLPRAAVRALLLVPIAVAILVGIPAAHWLRFDFAILGFVRAAGLSIAQAAVGIVIAGLALRESIPGRQLSRAALWTAFAAGFGIPALVLLATRQVSLLGPIPSHAWSDGVICLRTSALAAVPALAVSAVLVARAYALRPGVAGALYGLGCGLIADAGLRLWCEYSTASHVLLAHGGAVVVSTMAGAILAVVIDRSRA